MSVREVDLRLKEMDDGNLAAVQVAQVGVHVFKDNVSLHVEDVTLDTVVHDYFSLVGIGRQNDRQDGH